MKKKRNLKFDIKKEYSLCFDYLKKSKNFIYISIGIFLLSAFLGYFIQTPKIIYDQIMEFIKEITLQTKDMSTLELIQFITFNNLRSTFFTILLGIIFGIFPIVAAIANGYLLGFVALLSVNQKGFLSLLSLIPHGIFEFPAIFISIALGLRLGLMFFKKDYLLKKELSNCLRIFLLIIVPLLIIAGIIEGSFIKII